MKTPEDFGTLSQKTEPFSSDPSEIHSPFDSLLDFGAWILIFFLSLAIGTGIRALVLAGTPAPAPVTQSTQNTTSTVNNTCIGYCPNW